MTTAAHVAMTRQMPKLRLPFQKSLTKRKAVKEQKVLPLSTSVFFNLGNISDLTTREIAAVSSHSGFQY